MKTISTNEDLLELLDELLKENTSFDWDSFYIDREKKVPFFANHPDENVVAYFEQGYFLERQKVLELGCGPGRNAIYFAEKGCEVDAVDASAEALKWAMERADENNVNVNFIMENLFKLSIAEGSYDVVYDSGCFHHIAPHRRGNYINLIKRALKPNGYFALNCFAVGGKYGGADLTDLEVYRQRSLHGGLGFTEEKLRTIFHQFQELEIRKMRLTENKDIFALDGLLTALFKKR
ncbi:Cyclopropane-fatty-acyl-phospholipid synthase [Bacillus sp. THAF10]|nr:Cyclopropane-fatty-acyl-phospholipid synthase [Bacillus sp. THAF10]